MLERYCIATKYCAWNIFKSIITYLGTYKMMFSDFVDIELIMRSAARSHPSKTFFTLTFRFWKRHEPNPFHVISVLITAVTFTDTPSTPFSYHFDQFKRYNYAKNWRVWTCDILTTCQPCWFRDLVFVPGTKAWIMWRHSHVIIDWHFSPRPGTNKRMTGSGSFTSVLLDVSLVVYFLFPGK